jgi:haloacid dehalogenase-like hydrolase
VLISPEAERQLDKLRRSLALIPGVFLDDRHQHSIRAFTYQPKPSSLVSALMRSIRSSAVGDGAVAPLPTLLMQHLMADLGLDRLTFQHTMIDTTITAKEVDKGTGLSGLRDWVLGAGAETIAVGDQEPDLAMFRAATRSFAPANIGCPRQARLLGCRIVRNSYQRGLLEIVGLLTHPDGRGCESCVASDALLEDSDLFMNVLRTADRKWSANMIRAVFNRDILKILSGSL